MRYYLLYFSFRFWNLLYFLRYLFRCLKKAVIYIYKVLKTAIYKCRIIKVRIFNYEINCDIITKFIIYHFYVNDNNILPLDNKVFILPPFNFSNVIHNLWGYVFCNVDAKTNLNISMYSFLMV